MAYAAWSVSFGEQPSAAKWNILGTNDASFNDGTGIANDAINGNHIQLANNSALQALNASAVSTDTIKLGTDDYLRLSQLPYQDLTSNSTKTNVLIQSGWSFIQNDGSEASTKTITYPVAFTSILALSIDIVGVKSGSDPTSITDTAGVPITDTVQQTVGAYDIKTNNFVAEAKRTPASSGERLLFSWIAIGTKT